MTRSMSRSVTSAAKETPSLSYLLAYLEEGRVRVYAPRRQDLWVMQVLPEEERQRVETQLYELRRTRERTAVVEVRFPGHDKTRSVRVLCVRS